MSIWTTSKVTDDNLSRLGLYDICLGTDQKENSLNVAIAAGHKRILLAEGAVLTANLTIGSALGGGFIVSPGGSSSISLGAFSIDCQASGFKLQGFQLLAATGVALTISGVSSGVILRDVRVNGWSSHGIEITSTGNDNIIESCLCYSNGGDGLRIGASSGNCRVYGNFFWNNTGWGINDLSNSMIEGNNRLDSNTAGTRNTTSTFVDGKSSS